VSIWARVGLGLSGRIYGILLHVRYPRDLVRSYGDDMRAAFERGARRNVERDGAVGLAKFWRTIARDLLTPTPGPLAPRGDRRPGAHAVNRWKGKGKGTMGWTGGRRFAGFGEDLSFAVRSLVREPRFTGLVVGVLAVGIALNASAFAVLNAYLLKPLPFPEAQRLVSVRGAQAISWTEVGDVFDRAVSWDLDVFTILGEGRPEMVRGSWVTPDFLAAYGIEAQVGRTFLPEEADRGAAPVAMISGRLWRDRFGRDPSVLGRSFSAFTSDRPDHAELFTVVGVLPDDFWYFNAYTDVLAPIREERTLYAGRLRPDVPRERAESILTDMARSRMEDAPTGFRVEVVSQHEQHVASVRPTLVVLQAAVFLVLLIACANAAVLLLVRSARREHELGLRQALGAARTRLARQLLCEGGLIAGVASLVGLALASWALELGGPNVEAQLGLTVPGGPDALSIDGTVLFGAAALATLVGLAFGAVPLLTVLRGALASSFAEPRGGGTESKGRRRFRSAMVAAEVALSLALLVGAGLMVRSALHLQSQSLGFDPARTLAGSMGLREAQYPTPQDRVAVFEELRERFGSLPEVEAVGLASARLFSTGFATRRYEGRVGDRVTTADAVRWIVDESYFSTLRIPLLRGRDFASDDALDGEEVVVVSERLARDLFGGADPVGASIRLLPQGVPGMEPPELERWRRVVGVVADVEREVRAEPAGDIYATFRQTAPTWMDAVVRVRSEAPDIVGRLEGAIAEVDPGIPFANPERLDVVVDDAMEPTRYLASLLVGFSAFALILAIVGLYGVIAYTVRQQKRDIAIRIALGADRGSVVSMFVRQGLVMVGAGLVLGTLGGLLLGRALGEDLHGVSPGDPATHLSLAAILALSAFAAVWVPARRAAVSDPMGVLREE